MRVPRREVDRAMDVIGELIVRPRLEDADIQSERTVIIEEIRSYLDDPSEYCQILFQTAMFGDGPLGREICGDEADIMALPEVAIRDFWKSAYRPANTVVAVVGDLSHDEAIDPRLDGLRAPATARSRASRRRRCCRPVRGCARASATRARHRSASASRPSTATIPTAGRWRSSTPSSATA